MIRVLPTISSRGALAALLLCSAGCKGGGLFGDDTGFDEELVGILVTPEDAIVSVGGTVQLTATGLFADRTSSDITNLVQWSSSNTGVASVSDDLDSEGVINGVTVGTAQVDASYGAIASPTIEVSVTDAQLLGLTVEPKELDLSVGDEVQLQAIAAYSDGQRADSSSQVRWITGDGSVAQIATGGLLTAAGQGSTEIYAEWEGTASEVVPVSVSSGGQPDLKITNVTGEAGSDEITLTVTVKNSGDSGASEFWVDVFLDPSSTPSAGDFGDYYDYVSYAGPGDTAELGFTVPADSGSHTIWVLVDSDQAISESNENNNSWSGTLSVDGGGSGSGPNLMVTYFDWIADDTYIYYVVDVYNGGGEDVGSFYVDVYVDQDDEPELYSDGDDYTTIHSLGAGETTYADFLIEETCYWCYSWVLIDSYDYVEETDESDNVDGPLYVYSE